MNWTQLEPGTLFIDRRRLSLGSVTIECRRQEVAFEAQGAIEERHTLFGFTDGRGGPTLWNGVGVTAHDVATTRCGIQLHGRGPETLYAITLKDDAYSEFPISQAVQKTLSQVSTEPAVVRSHHAKGLRAYVKRLINSRVPPRSFSREVMGATLLRLLAAAVEDQRDVPERSTTQRRRVAVVQLCIEYMEKRVGEPISLSDLSLISELRPRSLINAFEAITGSSPMTYLRARRLMHVRRTLENAKCEKVRIIDVAADWGFFHMGHFASAYRAMFGETPSQTLTRNSHSPLRDNGALRSLCAHIPEGDEPRSTEFSQ